MDMEINPAAHVANNFIKFAPTSDTANIAFIWIENNDGQALTTARNMLLTIPGVQSIESTKLKNNMFLVSFDGGCTTACRIHQSIKHKGFDAWLFGC